MPVNTLALVAQLIVLTACVSYMRSSATVPPYSADSSLGDESMAAHGDQPSDFASAAGAVSDVLSAWGLAQDTGWPSDLGSDALLQAAADIAALRLPGSGSSAGQHAALLDSVRGDSNSRQAGLLGSELRSDLADFHSSSVAADAVTAGLDTAAASTAADLAFLGFDPSDAAFVAAYAESYSEHAGRDPSPAAAEAGSSHASHHGQRRRDDAARLASSPNRSSEHAGSSTAQGRWEPGGASSSGVPWHELLLSEPLESAPASSSSSAAAPAGQLPHSYRGRDAWSSGSFHGTWDGRPSPRLGSALRVPGSRAARSRELKTASPGMQRRGDSQKQQQRGWDDCIVVPRAPSRHQELAALRMEGEGAGLGSGIWVGHAERAIPRLHAQASCTLADAWPLGGCHAAASPVSPSRPQTAVPRRRGANADGKLSLTCSLSAHAAALLHGG